MSLVQTLRRARKVLAGGWSEPFCRDAEGRHSVPEAEETTLFSVEGALELSRAFNLQQAFTMKANRTNKE